MPDDPKEMIGQLRRSIDGLDEQIFSLLDRRLTLAAEIGHIKKRHDMAVVDGEREATIIRSLEAQFTGRMSAEQIHTMVATLLKLSHEVQAAV